MRAISINLASRRIRVPDRLKKCRAGSSGTIRGVWRTRHRRCRRKQPEKRRKATHSGVCGFCTGKPASLWRKRLYRAHFRLSRWQRRCRSRLPAGSQSRFHPPPSVRPGPSQSLKNGQKRSIPPLQPSIRKYTRPDFAIASPGRRRRLWCQRSEGTAGCAGSGVAVQWSRRYLGPLGLLGVGLLGLPGVPCAPASRRVRRVSARSRTFVAVAAGRKRRRAGT